MELICTTSIVTRPVQTCIATLTIGTISALSTNVFVRLYNTATGRTVIYTTTTSGAGLVSIDLSGSELLEKSTYKISVNTLSQYYDITIGSNTGQEVIMPVERVSGAIEGNVTLQTLCHSTNYCFYS